MRESLSRRLFVAANYTFLSILALITLYPFVYVLSASLSAADYVMDGSVVLLPIGTNFESYLHILENMQIWIAYANSFFYTIVGNAVSMFFTITAAYALSKKRLRGRTLLMILVTFTMWFKPGIVPVYINMQDLNLLDSRMGIIVGFAVTAFNLILMRTYFESVPPSLEEASKIDGANDLSILWNVYIPLSGPAIATVSLFYAIQRWNGYFWTMILLKDDMKIPLQVLLKRLIIEVGLADEYTNFLSGGALMSQQTVIYATIVISIIPMLLLYPFVQKYFTKGVMLGAVKE